MTIRRPYRVGGAIAALVAAALAAGCTTTSTSSGTTNTTSDLEKTNITVAAVPANDAAGLYVAQQQGFFADAGLHVKIVPAISSATVIANQLSGLYDVTNGNYVSYILANAREHDNLRVIAEGSLLQQGSEAIMIPRGSPITTVAGLKGKRIAVNVPDNIGTILVGTALEENGVRLSDVHLVPIPFPNMAQALQKHQVDAAWMPEPFVSSAEQAIGAQKLFDVDQGASVSFPITGYVVTKSWEQRYPRTAAAFTQALEKGQELADADRADAELAMMTYAGISGKTAAIMAVNTYPVDIDRIRVQRVANTMLEFGLLKHAYDVSQMTGG